MSRLIPLTCFLLLGASAARGQDSVKLTDVVRQGVGDLDLLRDVTPATLEAFRQAGGGELVLAIDVNEAADGSEKSSSQGVSFERVTLRVTLGGTPYTYDVFSTATQALLAPAGSTTRALTYTAVGDSGSNRITANAIQQEFDSLITVPVDRDLSSATAAVLEVRFLQTNVTLGDPEAFYDYTNGFEDLALVNQADATYLEDLEPGVSEAPAVVLTDPPTQTDPLAVTGWFSYPSAGDFYTVGYEDQFPNLGDYDFNDLLVSYQVQVGVNADGNVVQLKGKAYLVARGSGFSHDWRLRLSTATVAGDLQRTLTDPDTFQTQVSEERLTGALDLLGFADTRRVFPSNGPDSTVNTQPGQPTKRGQRLDFQLQLDAPLPFAQLLPAPFDPYLVVRNTGYEVHLSERSATPGSLNVAQGLTTFRDPQGYPYAFLFPTNWPHPWERVRLELAYPDLEDYVRTQGNSNKNWYQLPAVGKVRAYQQEDWEWNPPPQP
jgi:LruC domain-containing protein